jgi:hypothetical protein
MEKEIGRGAKAQIRIFHIFEIVSFDFVENRRRVFTYIPINIWAPLLP